MAWETSGGGMVVAKCGWKDDFCTNILIVFVNGFDNAVVDDVTNGEEYVVGEGVGFMDDILRQIDDDNLWFPCSTRCK